MPDTTAVTLTLTAEQAATVHAALAQANALCRDRELHALNLHESGKVGPVTRAEAWKTFEKWVQHENETAAVMQELQKLTPLEFSAWHRFSA